MGVWANGPDPRGNVVDLAGIAAVMRPALETFFSCRLALYDPNRNARGAYNPTTDARAGADPSVLVFDTGANGALIQPMRAAVDMAIGSQPNDINAIRFQLVKVGVEGSSPTQVLRAGLTVKVLDGGNAPELEALTFSLTEAIDNSLTWDHLFHATVIVGG